MLVAAYFVRGLDARKQHRQSARWASSLTDGGFNRDKLTGLRHSALSLQVTPDENPSLVGVSICVQSHVRDPEQIANALRRQRIVDDVRVSK